MHEALKELAQHIEGMSKCSEDDRLLMPGSRPYAVNKDNFHTIKEFCSGKKLCFVDGGNSEIAAAANFSVQFIRIAAVTMHLNKTISAKRAEFFALCRAAAPNATTPENGGQKYFCSTHFVSKDTLNLPGLSFPADTANSAREGSELSAIGNNVRRLAEIEIARQAVVGLEDGDILVLDGTLEAKTALEAEYLDRLYEAAKKKDVLVMSVAKTTTLLTEKGNSASVMLFKMGPKTAWYYYPIADINNPMHKAALLFAKLHHKSAYAFRVEAYKEQLPMVEMDKVIGFFAYNSKDLSFPGYPYGLIKADRTARVSEKEKAMLKARLGMLLESKADIVPYLASLGAHDVLDRI
jgi:hypothetical protein